MKAKEGGEEREKERNGYLIEPDVGGHELFTFILKKEKDFFLNPKHYKMSYLAPIIRGIARITSSPGTTPHPSP